MKKLLIVASAAILVALALTGAQAADDNWRLGISTDDGNGMYFGPTIQVGVNPSSSDGLDGYDVEGDFDSTTVCVASVIPGDSDLWIRDIRSGDLSLPKIWSLRVAALPDTEADSILLRFSTLRSSILPPESLGSAKVTYTLTMVDNKGITGAPVNGQTWDLTSLITQSPEDTEFFSLSLPLLTLSSTQSSVMLSDAYVFEFKQSAVPVPEPSCLLVLGSGLAGLAGFSIRKRRTQV